MTRQGFISITDENRRFSIETSVIHSLTTRLILNAACGISSIMSHFLSPLTENRNPKNSQEENVIYSRLGGPGFQVSHC